MQALAFFFALCISNKTGRLHLQGDMEKRQCIYCAHERGESRTGALSAYGSVRDRRYEAMWKSELQGQCLRAAAWLMCWISIARKVSIKL
jgi:hypothetical protein